jgi:Phage integrase, N-terminal SAM-like domain
LRLALACDGRGRVPTKEYTMTPLRKRMIDDMMLMDLASSTQKAYLDGVLRLAAHYRRSPELLTEDEVRSYLVGLRERGIAQGTFKGHHYGIRFLYWCTLDRDWPLFSKKRFDRPSRSACQ